MINIKAREIENIAYDAFDNAVRLFDEKRPEATDDDFTFFMSCLHHETGSHLYNWSFDLVKEG